MVSFSASCPQLPAPTRPGHQSASPLVLRWAPLVPSQPLGEHMMSSVPYWTITLVVLNVMDCHLAIKNKDSNLYLLTLKDVCHILLSEKYERIPNAGMVPFFEH